MRSRRMLIGEDRRLNLKSYPHHRDTRDTTRRISAHLDEPRRGHFLARSNPRGFLVQVHTGEYPSRLEKGTNETANGRGVSRKATVARRARAYDDAPGSGQVADRFAATTIARGPRNCPACERARAARSYPSSSVVTKRGSLSLNPAGPAPALRNWTERTVYAAEGKSCLDLNRGRLSSRRSRAIS